MELGTLFIVGVTTARMIMPGMPDIKIPGMEGPGLNAPTRTLTMDLTSKKKAGADAKAECAIPEGLKLGPKVNLVIDRPTPVKETKEEPGEESKPDKTPKMVMKMYWQCAEKVPEGQPKIIDTGNMTAGMSQKDMAKFQQRFQKAMDKAMTGSIDGSHAYWPGPNAKPIAKDAETPGPFKLTTNYCGGTSITFAEGQDFLAPIDVIGMDEDIDLAKTIKVEWKSIPNATAYLLTAFAGSEKEMVMWTSSTDPDMTSTIDRALSSKELQKYLENGILIEPTKTSCRIPAGIFKNVGKPMLMVTAFGTDRIQSKDDIETQVVVRSNATVMLGAGGMMGGMDQGEDTSTDDDSGDQPAVENSDQPAEESSETKSDDDSGSLASKLKKKLGKFGKR